MAVKKGGVGSAKLSTPKAKTRKPKNVTARKNINSTSKNKKAKTAVPSKSKTKKQKDTRYKGGTRERADLKWDKEEYMVSKLGKRDIKEVKKEYSRIRSILRKRVERMQGTEWDRSKFYKTYIKGIKTIKELVDDRELYHELNKLARALISQRSSIKGLIEEKEHFLEVINRKDSAYKGIIDEDNYWEYIDYLNALQDAGIKYTYDSERELEYFKENRKKIKKMIDDKDKLESHFKKWLKKKDKRYEKYIDENGNTGDKARELFNKNKG